jgi:hypothetical protein
MNTKKNFLCLYISDLHINKKKNIRHILHKKNINFNQLDMCLKSQIQNLIKTIPNNNTEMRIFIVGDVADNFDIFKRFFNIYHQQIKIKTYLILGNHEFKGLFYQAKKYNYPQIVNCYQQFLADLNIELIEDNLIVEQDKKIIKYSLEDILNWNEKTIKKNIPANALCILGALSGSKIFLQIHTKLKEIVPNIKLVIINHFPFKNWLSESKINHQWVYLYGHSHHNVKKKNCCYADNQIGVYGNLKFKHFIF